MAAKPSGISARSVHKLRETEKNDIGKNNVKGKLQLQPWGILRQAAIDD